MVMIVDDPDADDSLCMNVLLRMMMEKKERLLIQNIRMDAYAANWRIPGDQQKIQTWCCKRVW